MILLSFIYVLLIFTEWDRNIKLWFTSIDTLIENYKKKPHPKQRTVVIIECESGVCSNTLKSLLDQSVRVHDISINTDHPEKINPKLKVIANIHKPGTELVREPSADTKIIKLQNGETIAYDSIESQVNNK